MGIVGPTQVDNEFPPGKKPDDAGNQLGYHDYVVLLPQIS